MTTYVLWGTPPGGTTLVKITDNVSRSVTELTGESRHRFNEGWRDLAIRKVES